MEEQKVAEREFELTKSENPRYETPIATATGSPPGAAHMTSITFLSNMTRTGGASRAPLGTATTNTCHRAGTAARRMRTDAGGEGATRATTTTTAGTVIGSGRDKSMCKFTWLSYPRLSCNKLVRNGGKRPGAGRRFSMSSGGRADPTMITRWYIMCRRYERS
ncbi:uncharacterized protein K452DRAFT_284641 [Aplosporella prunicola CBS 121167]|uniref:Uncharacterized protein n=1 Tax=Aplosporella prunicola CBS 121167 TaxID=1176127 RepID=A0A6A6BPP2_9PEZI|nr:uncharacterized protein K452DRAFT_284641 [Aplosporella prunicola CBS 121167]KAF2145255.1 hypothetical protein K452DRAFT_284641 [Aplosporella prunicola CBS 121167]